MPQSNQIQGTSIVFGIRGWRWELLSSGIEEKPGGNRVQNILLRTWAMKSKAGTE